MRKKIKLPLEMADGVKVRTLDELKDNWSLEKVVENYLNGRLATWLNDRYYTELAEQVSALAEVQDNTALQKELCRIFDVDFEDEEDIDVDAVSERNRKLEALRQYTADDTVLKNVDIVAFDQEELGDILDAGENVIYLFNNTFSIPLSVKNKKYIGIGKAECIIHSKDVVDFQELGIEFENVVFDEKYRKIEEEESPSKFYNEGCKYFEAKQYKEALECFKKAASKNHAGALFHVGKIYDLALGVEQDYRLAAEYYSKAVSFNSGKAANNLANMYRDGVGLEKDMKKAIELYKKAIDGGSYVALANLGDMYNLGQGVEQNYEEAMKWYKKAADGGIAWSMNEIGDLYYNGNGVDANYTEAVNWYRKGAEAGNANAMGNLGWMYRNGQGVEQSDTGAVKWYRKGAEAGNANAMNNLGWMYQNGKGVEQSDTEAVKWYRKGAEAGNANAMCNLGWMYENGKGVEQNAEEAKKWYKKAADGDNAWAMNRLGELSSSYSEELKWYNLAADKGNSDAMFNLVWMYRMGNGVDKDINTALYWAKKSASLNNARGMVAVGDIYWTWKDYNEASQWYKKAMDVDPSNSEAKGRYNRCIIRIQNPDWDGNGVLFH
ncbi:hypothetical protein [Phascolarctobacterium succinatutens]|uniref:SEL1-like repeat protein n=1 Tax=Phascolarctobacterium succinatutens TaxID=626940 RepID=UPI003079A2E3